MLQSLEKEVARAKAQGDKVVSGFTGGVKCPDVTRWEIGDVFSIPETFSVFRHTFENGKSFSEYIFVDAKSADGTERTKKFFPAQFTKTRFEVNDNGEATGVICRTEGTAATWYREQATINDAMNGLKGKRIKVSAITTIKAWNFDHTYIVDAHLLTLDFVEEEPETPTPKAPKPSRRNGTA